MKLAITQHSINDRGGAERVILKIAQKYDATIYTLGYDPKGTFDEFSDIDIRVFGKRGRAGSLFPKRVANALHYGYNFYNLKIKEDYDVVNPHMSPSEWVRNRNPRVLWYCHTPPRELYDPTVSGLRKKSLVEGVMYKGFGRVYSTMEKRIVDKIEAIATNSGVTNGRIKRIFGRSAEIINPGIDYKDFHDGGDGKYFIYPSRIAEQKRQEYAIEAFSIFSREKKYRGYKLILAGSMSERYADFKRYYEKLKGMNVKNVVFRPNPTDKELRNLYARSTAVLFAAINEDYGIVPLEGMASYKPEISVNEGGPRETVVDGKTGFLVGSPRAMAEKMRLVADNDKLAESIGREGRRRIEKHYSWDAFFTKFDPLARKVSRM